MWTAATGWSEGAAVSLLKALPSLAVLGVVVAAAALAPRSAFSAEPLQATGPASFDARFSAPDSRAWRMSARPLAGKTIAVLVANDFNAVEAFYPIYRWREAGARIVVVGAETGEFSGRGRYPLRADASAAGFDLTGVDIVFVPGGDAPKTLRENPDMVRLVQEAERRNLWIVAACHGPQLLARAGLLDGRRLTAWPDLVQEIENAGGDWLDQVVVRDGRLLTSQDPWTMDSLVFAVIDAVAAEPSRTE